VESKLLRTNLGAPILSIEPVENCVAVLGLPLLCWASACDSFELKGEITGMFVSGHSEAGELGNDPIVDVGEATDVGESNEAGPENTRLVSMVLGRV